MQVFIGAVHTLYWNTKLRMHDIYENDINKMTFGVCLEICTEQATNTTHMFKLFCYLVVYYGN